MDTNRDDFGIAIRSAFLSKGTQQRFSLFVLLLISIVFLLFEKIETKPLNYSRSIIKDVIYRGSLLASAPTGGIKKITSSISKHIKLYEDHAKLKKENSLLKNNILQSEYYKLENQQLKKLIDESSNEEVNFLTARVIIDKRSPYLNSFVINSGSNKKIKNSMAVLDDEKNFIGRIVDVNFFSSRVLLISDLNSKIPVIVEPSGAHGILSGRGNRNVSLEYLPENHKTNDGDAVYTSGKEGIFKPGIPVGEVKLTKEKIEVLIYSELDQISFVNINLAELNLSK
jgi:rod shape-determining protein MreC